MEKCLVWKESAIATKGRREVEVGTLLLSANKNNVVTDKLANADLLKVSAFIFFDKTSLQKPYYVMIENISSNKT